LEQAEGYVNALEKSTSSVSSWREVFEHDAPNAEASGERLKVVLQDLTIVRSGRPDFFQKEAQFVGS
jgi:hypothetical protein